MTVPIPLSPLPPISDEDKAWLSYNPNTCDVIDWIQDYARRALLASASIPSGWKLVPIEPTEEMQLVGALAVRIDTTALNKAWTANKVYRQMIGAAPLATPASGVPDETSGLLACVTCGHPVSPSSPPSSVETSNTAGADALPSAEAES